MDKRASGFSLNELLIIVAIIGIVASAAVPSTDEMFANQRLNTSSRSVAKALSYARSESIRSGNIHVVFFGTDTAGNPLQDADGNTVPILVVDDGRPGSAQQNCAVDGGETTLGLDLEKNVTFGATAATASVPTDAGTGVLSSGSTFTDGGGNAANWVLFRPEGTPLAFTTGCGIGGIGTGGGAIYLTNGSRDASIVLTPLGANRVHNWNGVAGAWTI